MAEHVHHDTAGHTGADAQYEATPPGAQYEHTDARVGLIVRFLLWLAVTAAVIHFGLALLFNLFVAQREATEAPRYPLAATESDGPRLPPEPRLQRFPREDILNYRLGEDAVLQNYGWVDREAGTVHIPIQDAMRLVLERRMLPSRPAAPAADAEPAPTDGTAGRGVRP